MRQGINPTGGRQTWPIAGATGRRWTLGLLTVILAALALVAVLEGDLPEAVGRGVFVVGHLLRQFGLLAAFALLYVEESGVPMPMPGDVFVMYIGHHSSQTLLTLVGAWLALISVVVLGATNLFWISRRWGRSLVERRLGKALHLTPARIDRAEHWFERWGVWTLIFGRHIPGLRVPLTVAAGIFRVRYRVFVLSVAISTAIWAGVFIAIGAVFGGRVGHLLQLHREGYVIIPALIVLAFGTYIALMVRRMSEVEAPT
jgi:membrane protein DedA with SNARE-associated domain